MMNGEEQHTGQKPFRDVPELPVDLSFPQLRPCKGTASHSIGKVSWNKPRSSLGTGDSAYQVVGEICRPRF